MNRHKAGRPRWAVAAGILAILFGLATIWSGGVALFGGAEARATVGDAVPFVLWFNFFAGFVYVAAGVGLWLWRAWGAWMAIALALATLIVFAAFGLHVAGGGAFETRTVFAMAVRSLFWVVIAEACRRSLRRPGSEPATGRPPRL